jgi:hypothetical protein
MIVFFGPTDNWSWDPSFYYAQLRSPIIEHDLDFRNETVTRNVYLEPTVTGLQPSPWPIGPSVLWSPFFLIAHSIVQWINPAYADGFSFPYIALVSLGSMAFGGAALVMVYKICRYFGSTFISLVATFMCLGATPLFFYMFRQPIMAHTTGLFASAAIVLIYMRLTKSEALRKESGLLFGVALGLCFLTRWNGVVFVVVPCIYFLSHLCKALRANSSVKVKNILQQTLIMTVAYVLTISPQLSLWYRLHNRFLVSPQGDESFVQNILPINTLKIFFDTNRGLVFWCPFVLIGIVGIVCIRNSKIRWMGVLTVASQIVLIGYRVDWFSGGGFGTRYFIELLPFIAIGFVVLASKTTNTRRGQVVVVLGMLILIFHQSALVYAVEHGPEGWISFEQYLRGKPIGLSWQGENIIRLIGHPSFWLYPRPYVQEDRQTMLTNYIHGAHNLRAYLITGTAVILAPTIVGIIMALMTRINKRSIQRLFVGTMLYMVVWSVYIFYIN